MDGILKVLVVEDNREQAELISKSLKKFNSDFIVDITESGRGCLDKLSKSKYEAVVLDYQLPETTGLEVLEKISTKKYDTPIIIISGHGSEQIAVDALKKGAHDYLIKNTTFLSLLPKVVQKTIEQHHLENKLRTSENKYQNIFENATDSILILNPNNFQILEANGKTVTISGYTKEELYCKSFLELFPSEQRFHLKNLLEQTIASGTGSSDTVSVLKSNHERTPVDLNTSLIELNSAEYILCNIKNIAEKKHLQSLILNSKKRLQSTFDGIDDIIYQVNKDFEIVIVNKKFAENCNAQPEELIGKKCYKVFYNGEIPCAICPVRKTFATKESDNVEKTHNMDVFEISSYPILTVDGELESVAVYTRNITEKRKLEKTLIQTEKLATIGLLASGIAHELRNPLNIIETARYYIEEFLIGKNPDISSKLDIIRKNVKRSSAIINNLLEFSRHSKHDRELIDIKSLIENTVSMIKKELDAKNIDYHFYHNDSYTCYFSVDSLKQVFLNLIINAIQAMQKGGKLSIYIEQTKRHWVDIKITDTGIGIPPENLDQIFSPFFTTKEPGEGTGLGLYITHMIIERDGGKIRVESEPGVGSTFTVSLPQKEQI